MAACLGSTGEEVLQDKALDETVQGGVAEESDLSGSTHTSDDDKARKKKRLDARRSKPTRAKTRTRSPEDVPVEDQRTKADTRVGTLGCGSVDPFRSIPDLENADTDVLAHHYNTVFVHTTTPPGNRRQWFSYALSDPALFHTTLFIAASHVTALRRSPILPAFFKHRGEVIRIVNGRLRNGERAAATDGTIGAVAGLLVTDSLAGHPERVKAHIEGLQQLVAARGGLEQVEPIISSLVGWVDVLASASLQLPPVFQTRAPTSDLNLLYRPPSLSTVRYADALAARLSNFTNNPTASALVGTIYWGLRNVTLEREDESRNPHSTTAPYFSDRTESLERQIQQLLHEFLPPVESPPSGPNCNLNSNAVGPDPNLILRLFAHASLIYIILVLRDVLESALCRALAQRLEFGMDIDDTELNVLLGTFPDLMLWVLFIGGGSARLRSKVWFARTAARILRIQKVSESKEIQEAATRFLWPEGRENYDPTVELAAEEVDLEADPEMDADQEAVNKKAEEKLGLETLTIS